MLLSVNKNSSCVNRWRNKWCATLIAGFLYSELFLADLLYIRSHTKYVHIKSTTVYAPRRNWDFPPTPHPQASVPPPPCFWGEGNTLWRERGWESPNSDEGHTLWYSLYVRTLWFKPLRNRIRLQIWIQLRNPALKSVKKKWPNIRVQQDFPVQRWMWFSELQIFLCGIREYWINYTRPGFLPLV